MNDTRLMQRARQLLSQKLVPGAHQSQIRRHTKELETIVRNLSANPGIQRHVVSGCERVYDELERELMRTSSTHILHSYMQDALNRFSNIIAIASTPRTDSRMLIEKGANTKGIPVHWFSHINYGFLTTSSQDTYSISAELEGAGMLEKHYRVSMQWNTKMVGAPMAWDHTGGEDVKVGIVDTGCDYNHEEIKERFGKNKGYDFIGDVPDPMDDNGHGTHVAGTVAGKTTGVASGCEMIAYKFLNQHGSGRETDFLRAAERAIDDGVDVLNGSFGSPRASRPEHAMCDALAEAGIIFVSSAGNAGTSDYGFPASFDSVVSVAAIDKNKRHAKFSQYNDQVDVCAPGVDVPSAKLGGGLVNMSGTSMSAPIVTGAAALYLAVGLLYAEARAQLLKNVEYLGDSHKFGAGMIDLSQYDWRQAA